MIQGCPGRLRGLAWKCLSRVVFAMSDGEILHVFESDTEIGSGMGRVRCLGMGIIRAQ